MRIPCAFQWHKCDDPAAKRKEGYAICDLYNLPLPRWVKTFLSEHCPFLGKELTSTEMGKVLKLMEKAKGKTK